MGNEKDIHQELADMDDFDNASVVKNADRDFTEQEKRNLTSVGGTHSTITGGRYPEKCKDCRGTGRFYSYTGRYVGQCFKCKGKGVQVFKTSPEARQRQCTAAAAKKKAAVSAKAKAAGEWLAANPERAKFLAEDWEFPLSLLGSLMQYGSLTEKQVAAIDKCVAKRAVRKAAEAKQDENGLDISGIPTGRYLAGDVQVKVQNVTKEGRWEGWVFVKSENDDRLGSQKPGATYRGKYEAELKLIAADPLAAAIAFGRETGTCCCCGRTLTNPESIEAGIGPICATRF